ncbi:hypothetical protein PM082_014117 [Marasmius tenuissimus]|nr:hypothetical protein PM082_014117 [Marasmius tenuissimus]
MSLSPSPALLSLRTRIFLLSYALSETSSNKLVAPLQRRTQELAGLDTITYCLTRKQIDSRRWEESTDHQQINDSIATLLEGGCKDDRTVPSNDGNTIANYPNPEFVQYANTLVEFLQSHAQTRDPSTLRDLANHIYKNHHKNVQSDAKSFLTTFPDGGRPVTLDEDDEVWYDVKKRVSKSLANLVRRFHKDKVLPEGAFEEPNLLVLDQETLSAPLILIYRIVTAISLLPSPLDIPLEHQVYNCCVVLKEVIDAVPVAYWDLEDVQDNISAATGTALGARVGHPFPWDGVIDEHIPVEIPRRLDQFVSIFLTGVASIYKHITAKHLLVNHPFCRSGAPIRLTCVESERHALNQLHRQELRQLLASWSIPRNMQLLDCLASAMSSACIPHCAAASMAALTCSPLSGLSAFRFEDGQTLTVGTVKKCCPACSLLCTTLEREFGVKIKIAPGHDNWSPWWAPDGIPDSVLEKMKETLIALFRKLFRSAEDSEGSEGDSPVSPVVETDLDVRLAGIDLDVLPHPAE